MKIYRDTKMRAAGAQLASNTWWQVLLGAASDLQRQKGQGATLDKDTSAPIDLGKSMEPLFRTIHHELLQ